MATKPPFLGAALVSSNVSGELTRSPASERVASSGKAYAISTAPFDGVAKGNSGSGILSDLFLGDEGRTKILR